MLFSGLSIALALYTSNKKVVYLHSIRHIGDFFPPLFKLLFIILLLLNFAVDLGQIELHSMDVAFSVPLNKILAIAVLYRRIALFVESTTAKKHKKVQAIDRWQQITKRTFRWSMPRSRSEHLQCFSLILKTKALSLCSRSPSASARLPFEACPLS